MTSIGVEQGASALQLHSCPACGRHSWRSDGVEVDRSTLLAALRVRKAEPAAKKREARPAASPAPAVPAAPAPSAPSAEDERRSELQRLLAGFTVHGSTS